MEFSGCSVAPGRVHLLVEVSASAHRRCASDRLAENCLLLELTESAIMNCPTMR